MLFDVKINRTPKSNQCLGGRLMNLALAPLDAEDVLELQAGGVDGELVGRRGSLRADADLRVQVEDALSAAWRPDQRLNSQPVGLKVIVLKRTFDGGLERCLYDL